MKQAEDAKNLELALEEATHADITVTKRGRGRPAKEDALTPAQRAKRYRDALRAGRAEMRFNRDESVTKNERVTAQHEAAQVDQLEAAIRAMTRSLEQKTRSLISAHSELRIMTEKFEVASKAPTPTTRNQVERAKMAQTIKQLEAQLEITEEERNAAFRENSNLKLLLANNGDENKNITIKKLETECFERQHKIIELQTTARTKMDELKIENSALLERNIHLAKQLEDATAAQAEAELQVKMVSTEGQERKKLVEHNKKLQTENSTLRQRLIKTTGELQGAQDKLMAESPAITVTKEKTSRKKSTPKAK